MRYLLIGVIFSLLWSSASVATKLGLVDNDPFVLSNVRFFLAGALMIGWSHLIKSHRLPQGKEWQQIAVYGLLNVTIYLGAFVLAMKQVAAGIGTLSVATNPLIIGILSAIFLKRPFKKLEIWGLAIGLIGVGVATYPLLLKSYATVQGVLILLFSMLSYSIGTIYYSSRDWNQLPITAINGWQVFFGGLFLLPVTVFFGDFSHNTWGVSFWGTVLWLAIPVSIGAVQLWLYLIRIDPVKAAQWLFLCPISGFAYAAVLMKEPLSLYTLVGTLLVLGGLYLGQRDKFVKKKQVAK